MKYYSYNERTSIYVGEYGARLDPLETQKQGKNIYLLPANATWIKPKGNLRENEVFVFENNKWIIKINFIGTKYYIIDDNGYLIEEREIQDLGESLDEKILIPPDYSFSIPKWDGEKWIEGELEVYVIDENSFFVAKKLKKVIDTDILIEPNESLVKPKWNGSKWIEGLTQEELDDREKNSLISSKISEMQRALAIEELKTEGKLDANGDLIK